MATRAYSMEARTEGVVVTRKRILDATEDMFREHWWEEMTLNGIAAAAGVSHQTVLNHFGSKDGVLSALIEARHSEVLGERGHIEPGDTAGAVTVLLRQYEATGLANARATHQEHRVPSLKAALDEARAWHRGWIERTFAHALPPGGAARRQKIAAFIGATEVAVWKSLRHDYGFSKRDTAAAMTALVTALEKQP